MLDPSPDHQGKTLTLLRGIEKFLQTSKSFSPDKISAEVLFACFGVSALCLFVVALGDFVCFFLYFPEAVDSTPLQNKVQKLNA